jgi:CDP-glucose 4,6-dehydratase
MGGYDPYSNSKGCAELVASSFRKSFFNPDNYEQHGVGLASARAGNVIGGGDWALDRLIPDILKAFEDGRAVEIRSPHAIRPWQHVLEPLSGYLAVAEKLFLNGADYSEAWNFGPRDEDAKPVQQIVESLTDSWGLGASWFLSEGEHPHEAHYLKLDCSKAKMKLNWQPVWDLQTTLTKIVDWHKAWLANDNMHDYTLAEIKDYMNTRTGLE